MREIKFRAWNNEFKEFKFMSLINYLGGRGIMDDWADSEHSVWEQYTGLKDKNGVEIYEGDIVNVTWSRDDTEGENYAIAYDPNNDGYSAFDFVDWYEDMNGLSYAYIDGQITVIGNIFENHELLEEKK